MKQKKLLLGLLALVMLYACRKAYFGGDTGESAANGRFSVNEARTHIKALVKSENAYNDRAQTQGLERRTTIKTGQKMFLPLWDRATLRTFKASADYVEVPIVLSKRRIPMYNFPKDNVKQKADESVAKAAIQRLVIYKDRRGKVGQRLLTYIPDKQYLVDHGYELIANELGDLRRDFCGYMEYRNWKGSVVSVLRVEKGKVVRTYRPSKADRQRPAKGQQDGALATKQTMGGGEENCITNCTPVYEFQCWHDNDFPEDEYAPECGDVLVGFDCWEYCWYEPVDPEPCPWGDCGEEPCFDCEVPCIDCEGPGQPEQPNQPKEIKVAVKNPCIKEQVDNAKNAKTTIRQMLNSTFANEPPLDDFILDIRDTTGLSNDLDGQVRRISGIEFELSLNANTLPNASKEYILSTVYHEILHAFLQTKFQRDASGKYIISDEHEDMANNYILLMTGALQIAFPNLSATEAWALSWGGLQETPFYNNKLTAAQKQQIIDINSKHKNKQGSGGDKLGTYCN